MKPLTANFKTLYQCKKLWIFHLTFIGIYTGAATSNEIGIVDFTSMAIFSLLHFFCGCVIASVAADIFSKPFAFCLPGQIKSAQKMIFLIWLLITVIFTLMAVSLFKNFKTDYPIFIVSLGLMSFGYWLGVAIIPRLGLFIVILLYIILVPFLKIILKSIEPMSMVLAHPWAVLLISGILSYFLYRSVGRIDNVRRLCILPSPWWQIWNRFNRKSFGIKQDHRIDRVVEGASNFFSGRIKSNNNSKLLAHFWGQVYLIIGSLVANWKSTLLGGLWIGLIIPYTVTEMTGNRIFLITDMMSLIIVSLLFSLIFNNIRLNLFILIERKEHFWRGVIFLSTAILIFLCLIISCIFIFSLLSGYVLSIKWILLVVPIIIVPMFGGIVILFEKDAYGLRILSMVITFLIAWGLTYYLFFVIEDVPFYINLLIIIIAAAITWGLYFAVLYYISMKQSLC